MLELNGIAVLETDLETRVDGAYQHLSVVNCFFVPQYIQNGSL